MNNNVSLVSGTVLLVAAVGAVVFLAYEHVITGGAAVAILSTVISLGGGAIAVHTGVSAGASAASSGETAAKK